MSYRDKDELYKLYVEKDMDQSEIAKKYGVHQTTISTWVNKHNIKKPLDNEEYLRKKYWGEGMSMRDIAEEIGSYTGSVGKAMDRHGIEKRKSTREKLPQIQTNTYGHECWRHWEDGTNYGIYVHRLLAVAEYGIKEVKGMDVHHTNGIPWDNRPSNIELLSREEHNRKHLPERDDNGRFTA